MGHAALARWRHVIAALCEWVSRSDVAPFRKCATAARRIQVIRAGKEEAPVKQFKELNASIAALHALLAGGDMRPEQRKNVEAAIEQLKRLRRRPDAKGSDVYACVRQLTERLVSAFFLR